MIIQKSRENTVSVLYLVPTPIGNFDDMTFRAVACLKNADIVFAEDTRVTKVLLSHFAIDTPLKNYHIFNEDVQTDMILSLLKEGKNIALVSDAGLPCISDPGFQVSKAAIDAGFPVIALPGANAALTALVASGLPSEHFMFYGFLNSRPSKRIRELKDLADFPETLIFYEAPHRIKETIAAMHEVFGNREIAIARELTKTYEEYVRGTLEDIDNANLEFKGEIVIIVRGASLTKSQEYLGKLDIPAHYSHYLDQGVDSKEAMKMVARDRKISKSDVYREIENRMQKDL
jgi:16S rRNA (cytidine1402-2'-O)-methyltransferase